ncbi:MAG: 50S ribosomal protein L11 methyltransferase [Anaerolineales bacterium]|jgi:ribosomal protein L11 methyltransferase
MTNRDQPSQWLEVALVVDGELAEAVAEVLARFAPNGVVIESTAITPQVNGPGRVEGPLRVAAYLPVESQLEEVRQRLEEALWYLGRIQPLPKAEYQLVRQADWAEAWKRHYHPIAVGRRLMIVPVWLENPEPTRVPIRVDPGMAFGTGTHPTTQLCLQFIEDSLEAVSPVEPLNVIDLGCGSGILSIAALKLGARHALGVDIESQAIAAARQNGVMNGVAPSLELGEGSLAEIRRGEFSLRKARLVLANILAPILIRLLDEGLGDLLEPDGELVLSGILDEQAGDVQAAAARNGLRLAYRRQLKDWVALVLVKV